MRTTIKQTSALDVTLSYICPLTGAHVRRVFFVAACGIYVREGDKQVCDYLKHTGPTLLAKPEKLLSVIRREWRKANAVKRRDEARIRR